MTTLLETLLNVSVSEMLSAKAVDDSDKNTSEARLEFSDTRKRKWFHERTAKHIRMVQEAAKQIADAYPQYAKQLMQNARKHDVSKYKEPEYEPYIELSWCKKINKDPTTLQNWNKIQNAILHHLQYNKHHPEYYSDDIEADKPIDVSAMDDISICEMVADWVAMSKELQTNTPREWYISKRNTRWIFSDEQDKLIDKLLSVFDKESE